MFIVQKIVKNHILFDFIHMKLQNRESRLMVSSGREEVVGRCIYRAVIAKKYEVSP